MKSFWVRRLAGLALASATVFNVSAHAGDDSRRVPRREEMRHLGEQSGQYEKDFLKTVARLRAVSFPALTEAESTQIASLLTALDDNKFAVREKAMHDLFTLADSSPAVQGALRKVERKVVGPEVDRRVEQVRAMTGFAVSWRDVNIVLINEIAKSELTLDLKRELDEFYGSLTSAEAEKLEELHREVEMAPMTYQGIDRHHIQGVHGLRFREGGLFQNEMEYHEVQRTRKQALAELVGTYRKLTDSDGRQFIATSTQDDQTVVIRYRHGEKTYRFRFGITGEMSFARTRSDYGIESNLKISLANLLPEGSRLPVRGDVRTLPDLDVMIALKAGRDTSRYSIVVQREVGGMLQSPGSTFQASIGYLYSLFPNQAEGIVIDKLSGEFLSENSLLEAAHQNAR